MSSSRKKERDRLKRKRKQQEQRKRKVTSQFRILESERAETVCYATADWREQGITSIVVLKKLRNGGQAFGAFLVDLWCLGLKDCWGRLQVSTEEFQDVLDRGEQRGTPMEPMDVETARRLVAGGVRFAQMNGFRLPAKYERWIRILGIDPSQADVDVSDFGVGGKLRYVGPLDDLGRRLVRQPVDEFLKREDVEFIGEIPGGLGVVDDDEYEDDDYEDDYGDEEAEEDEAGIDADFEQEMMAQLDETRDKLGDAVKRWCFANNQVPSAAIPNAVEVLLTSLLQVREPLPEGDEEISPAAKAENRQLVKNALELHEPQEKVEIAQALDQVQAFVASFKSPAEMFKTVGMDEPEDA